MAFNPLDREYDYKAEDTHYEGAPGREGVYQEFTKVLHQRTSIRWGTGPDQILTLSRMYPPSSGTRPKVGKGAGER